MPPFPRHMQRQHLALFVAQSIVAQSLFLAGCASTVPVRESAGTKEALVIVTRPPPPSPPTPQPLTGATHLGFSHTGLCGSFENVIRCLRAYQDPIDVTLPMSADQFFVYGYPQAGGCARLRSKSVVCWIGTQMLAVPPFTDAVDIKPLYLGSNQGVCVQSEAGTLKCFFFLGLEVRAIDFAPFVEQGGVLPHARYIDGCLVSVSEQKPRVTCASGQGLNPAEIEGFFARGWTRWQSGYAMAIPQGRFPETYSFGIDQSGILHGVGANFYGQLGNGKRGTSNDKSDLTDLGKVSAFAVSGSHVCAIVGGRVACWGEASAGQVPSGERLELAACKVDEQATKTTWRKTALASNKAAEQAIRSCEAQPGALDCALGQRMADPDHVPDNYRIYKTDGQCLESPTPVGLRVERSPVFVPGLFDAVEVVVARNVSCALRKSGVVSCWGKPDGFRLGSDGSPY